MGRCVLNFLGWACAFTIFAVHASANDLEPYAVRIVRGHPDDLGAVKFSGNTGIYLGSGLVLTAAHVAGSPMNPESIGVLIDNRLLPAQFVKAGDFQDVDVSLLHVNLADLPKALRALPHLTLCSESPYTDQVVVVVEPHRVATSVIVPPDVLPPGVSWKFSSLIRDVYTTGNSGSGVFDQASGCLMGIMSRKVEKNVPDGQGKIRTDGVAKYFVPADQISAFLGEALHGNK